jgi:hypothetical protein
MAHTDKLSVGQALDKLRGGSDTPLSKMQQLDSKIDSLDEEMRRMRATSRKVERDQRAAATAPQAQDVVPGRRPIRLWVLGITAALAIVLILLGWKWPS